MLTVRPMAHSTAEDFSIGKHLQTISKQKILSYIFID